MFTTSLNVLLSGAVQHAPNRGLTMKCSTLAPLGAAVIAMLGASSAAEAATINFTLATIDGTPTYTIGATIDKSSELDFDEALLVVQEVGSTDASGVNPGDFSVSISPSDIAYGAGSGPTTLPDPIMVSWTGDTGDMFTEKLTLVDSINRQTFNQIIVTLSGTVSDTDHFFVGTPAFLVVNASQFGGIGTGTSATFTNTASTTTGVIPEPSTWIMMALGFGALGFGGFRRRTAMLSA
jgi:hypothetical protein